MFEKAFGEGTDVPSSVLSLPAFSGSATAFAAAALARGAARARGARPAEEDSPFVLVVTPGIPEADTVADDLRVIEGECGVRALAFPPPLEDDPASTAARLKVSAALGAWRMRPYPLVVVAPSAALLTGVPDAAAVGAATMRLVPGDAESAFSKVQARLAAAGYERAGEVTAVGQYAVRGGVFDAWSPDAARPVRAEYFGEDLESLREFDPALQTSVKKIPSAELSPVSVPSGEETRLLDILPSGATILWVDHNSYVDISHSLLHNAGFRQIFTGMPAPPDVPEGTFQSSPLPGFAELSAESVRSPELLEAARGRLAAHLAAAEKKGALVVEDGELAGGFEVPGLVVVTRGDRVFAHRRRAPRAQTASVAGQRLSESFDIEPGEYVVHVDYGIGRFLGSTEVEVGGTRSEVFTIEYADGGKLHVPVTHAHLLSRYVGVKGEQVKLHRLDGRRWTKDKADAQRAVQDLAASLLETQARRAVVPGFAYDISAPGVAEFEAAFPYEETDDQARAIEDVKRDMAQTKPMDRLVCGDAGYGKTEVAMRAAFIAAMNGRQTALLAPTTVLAEQHYETFLAIRIEAMSRFQSPEEKKGTRARLLSGATDIVIGTHAILSDRVQFHDLGLIVIDEEQRFGVRHKEHLKRLRATADVLTMSATPIPRTLYLSMTGARDLSLLRTPPRERVAVETRIVRDTDETVRAAITRELARGGQVYFLYNRVSTIGTAAARLRALVPDARIEVAHGQMPPSMLSAKMQAFSKGRSDVLLCTTIVESGLDIPRANTILVDRADRFGLAELYQLRGRVGRSARQGYAYFLLPAEGLVDAEARERLDALKRHAGLGAGFGIAMRDLEIRGAGNLLGREQSGQLLQRTVARLKGENVPGVVDVTLNFDFLDFSPGSDDADASGACLPYDYVEDEGQRMDFHRRLAETSTLKDVTRLKGELADRYGKLPKAALRLVKLAELRVLCAQAGIRRIDVRKGRAVFYKADKPTPAFVEQLTAPTPEKRFAALAKHILQSEKCDIMKP